MSNNYGPKIVTDSILMLVDPSNAKSAPFGTSSVSDLSRNMNDMTASPGLTWSSDRSDPAVFGFDFGTASPSLFTNQAVNLPSIFAINAWINFPSSQKFQTVFSDEGQSSTLGYIWIYRGNSEDTLRVSYSNGVSFTTIGASGYFTDLNSQWINLCMTLNFSTGEVTFYRNGSFFSSATMTSPVPPRAGLKKVIGNYWTTPEIGNDSTVGRIGYFAVYSRALAAAEVLRNYEALEERFAERAVYRGLLYMIDAGNPRSFQSLAGGLEDLTRRRNNMLVTNATYDPANRGSISFTGNPGSSASVPGLLASDIQDASAYERTYDVWFKRNASGNVFNMVWHAYLPYFAFRADGQFHFSYATATSSFNPGTTQRNLFSGATYSDGTWYNAACTLKHDISATRATAQMYVNGALVASQQTAVGSVTQVPTYGAPFRLAAWHEGGPLYGFNGSIASMKIYDRILTGEEMRLNFESARQRFGI